jgi:hypothetical protein
MIDENWHLLAPFNSVAIGGDVQELGGVFSGAVTVTVLPSGRCFPIRVRNCVIALVVWVVGKLRRKW